MPAVFADSGYWIAVLDDADDLRAKASALSEEMQDATLVTTQMVLTEVCNHVSRTGAQLRVQVGLLISELGRQANVRIIPQTQQQFADALDRYAARPDQSWSLTDCASFLVMQTLGIDQALAYDRDFEQAGFVALLRD